MNRLNPILRPQSLRPTLTLLRAPTPLSSTSTRHNHHPSQELRVPKPTPFCPDVETFLTLIGRDMKQHAAKFPTWESLFSLSSDQLRELGIEPPRSRRYLIRWRERFAKRQFGPGGDLKYVQDGQAQLRILKDDQDPLKPKKYVVNVPAGQRLEETPLRDLQRVRGYKIQGARTISGPYAFPIPRKEGDGAVVKLTEGMWEDVRGHKIDGGERNRKEVQFKRRIQERREARERGEVPS